MKSGRDIGREHLATLESYLASGASLPFGRDGSLNLTELGKLTGIPKSSFYQNPAVREKVEQLRQPARNANEPGAENQPVASLRAPETTKAQRLERRVHSLEQQNAALVAEAFELRRQLKEMRLQIGREDMTIETGRRIPRPEGNR
jgi:hypothetical protein